MTVYLVKQTQWTDDMPDYINTTIYVCSTRERAQKYCQELNKEYGFDCTFDDDWNFVEINGSYPHYYDWEGMEVDEPLV